MNESNKPTKRVSARTMGKRMAERVYQNVKPLPTVHHIKHVVRPSASVASMCGYERAEQNGKTSLVTLFPVNDTLPCLMAVIAGDIRDLGFFSIVDKVKEAKRKAFLAEHIKDNETEIARQAKQIGSLPGLVDWLVNSIPESEDIFSSEANDALSRFFPRFDYFINLDERGSFSADVRNEAGETVFDIKAGNELGEGESSIFDDGYMKNKNDISGLLAYLIELGIASELASIRKGN